MRFDLLQCQQKVFYFQLGKWEFNREKKNDEHFANWCRYGQPVSSTTAASMGISEGVKYASYSAGELGRSARVSPYCL